MCNFKGTREDLFNKNIYVHVDRQSPTESSSEYDDKDVDQGDTSAESGNHFYGLPKTVRLHIYILNHNIYIYI